jgi:hypothetical protein
MRAALSIVSLAVITCACSTHKQAIRIPPAIKKPTDGYKLHYIFVMLASEAVSHPECPSI